MPTPLEIPPSAAPVGPLPVVDPGSGNPVEPQRAPSPLFGGPIVRPDGLAADSPPRSRHARIPVLFNPALRLVLFVVIAAMCVLALNLVMSVITPPGQLGSGHPLGAVVGIVAGVGAYLVLTMLIERRRPPVELALRRISGLGWGILAGAVTFGVVYVLITLLHGFRFAGLPSVDWSEWWLLILAVGPVAAIVEEILFRGIVFRLLEEFTGTWIAVAVSGLLFGFAHIANPDATLWSTFAIALEAGLLFGVLYAYTRSLWVVIGFHAAWNVTQGPLLGVVISGTGEAPSLISTTVHGPTLISGGSFGAEGSIVCVLVVSALAIGIGVQLVRGRAVVAPMWVRRTRQLDRSPIRHRQAQD